MEEIINLRKLYGEDSQEIKILEALVNAAIFDPVENVRSAAIEALEKKYAGIIKSGFSTDDKVFVDTCYMGRIKTGYICERPIEYIGNPSKAHSFQLSSETTLEQEGISIN